MSKGYVVVAQGDYVAMAELLARSIHATQLKVKNISIITDAVCDNTLFDYVIPISGTNVMLNRTSVYHLSPYDETVMLDADMIFLDDVSYWWNQLSKHELLITSQVQTYRGELITKSPYRKTFESNQLPNCYCAYSYFKKCAVAEEFFTLLASIISNWDEWTMRYTPEDRQTWPSIDVAMAIALKVMDYPATPALSYPTFTHMKSGCQGWVRYTEEWRTHLGVYISQGQLRLGNYVQSGILHYVDKELSNELLHLF